MRDKRNFEDKVIYQIYPKSFRDSNGDGLGDIRGITEKLDYLKQLGVDYIWSTPFFVSPQNDNGYDVADYYKIDPAYGTMEDLEELIREADKRGIGLMLDMVFNHESCVGYTNPKEQELSMSFSFHHLKVDYKDQKKWELQPFDFQALKDILNHWQTGMEEADGWNALFWNNHDQPRAVSRFCKEKKYQEKAAKMLASCIHLLRGTPYIYQGEEIGMTNAGFRDIREYRDVESLNYFEILKSQGREEEEIYQILGERSRDNARTPMQWKDSEGAGFGSTEPWIQVNENYRELNVQDQIERKDSIWQYYRRLIRLRKEENVISSGSYRPLLEKHLAIFAFERRTKEASLIAFHNFYPAETEADLSDFDLEGYVCLLDNYGERACEKTLRLRPYESAAFLKRF